MYDPAERLAEVVKKEGGDRSDGRLDPAERLAEGLTKEGGCRRDGRAALRTYE